jgi:MFS superfamily sulfate permease-like transporter
MARLRPQGKRGFPTTPTDPRPTWPAFAARTAWYIGTTLAARQQTRVNSHQELIALGAANIGAAFTGAYPVAGSFSRSSVNFYSGARTQVSSLVCAGVIVVVLLFLTEVFAGLDCARFYTSQPLC